MADAWDRVNDDDDVRVAILTGAGGSFCAGADLSAMSQSVALGQVRVRRVRPVGHQVAAQGLPADQAADRRRRGAGHRRRHRDPPGDRHPGRRGVRPVRRLRAPLGALPARRLRRTPPPPDPLHRRRRPAADRTPRQGARGEGDRPDRARRARRRGAGEGARAGRPGLRQRAAGGPVRAEDDAGLRGQARERLLEGRRRPSAPRSSPPTTPRRARAPSWRSGSRSSPAADGAGRSHATHGSLGPAPGQCAVTRL